MPKTSSGFTAIKRINALAELERNGVLFKPVANNEVAVLCPAHEDTKPSAHLNVETNIWHCFVCKGKGDIVGLLARHLKCERSLMIVQLSKYYDLDNVKSINSETVEKFHRRIKEAGPLLQALYDRGIRDEDIRKARLGFHNGRITIPVRDTQGRTLDVLRYLPGAPEKKFMHTPRFSTMRIYREEDLKYETVWIIGGPIKALAAGERLNGQGIGAVSSSASEGAWDPKWNSKFEGKIVYICNDVDAAGVAANNRIACQVAPFAKETKIVALPLDRTKYPKGDINDYIGGEGAGLKELLALQVASADYVPPTAQLLSERGTKEINLAEVPDPTNIGWRLHFEGVPAAMDETPYLVPRNVNVNCDRSQQYCHLCPIKQIEPDSRGYVSQNLSSSSDAILALVGANELKQRKALTLGLGIPRCKSVEFKAVDHHRVTDIRLSPQLTISGQGSGSVMQPALLVGEGLDLNTPYRFGGRVYPHPETQKATLVLNEAEETVDSLQTFKMSEEEREELEIFQPESDSLEAIETQLEKIYNDLAANVTRIYDRQDMHLTFDLAYHSPLLLNFGDREINGWTNVLIAGDSAQGKSETLIRLKEHYGLGERVECKSATVAGLLGGLQQLGTRWFVSWGIIPTHDRRFVALEEIKGASVEVLSKLTDMRSSGIAEIPKIERRRAHARTRLAFISNPRSSKPVAGYSFGVEVFSELAGSPEDLRRFDLGIMVAAGQVDASVVHETRTAVHTFTEELCRRLILWAWTRTRDQVIFEDETLEAIKETSMHLSSKYTEMLPLIDRGTVGHKVARLSAALAARLFSTDEARECVVVRPGHVAAIKGLLERSYDDPAVAYDRFSEAQKTLDSVRDKPMVKRFLRNQAHPRTLIEGLLHTEETALPDFQDWLEVDRDYANTVLSFLVRKHALRRVSRTGYAKTGEFIGVLRELSRGKLTDGPETFEDDEL